MKMEPQEISTFLRKVPLLRSLKDRQLKKLAARMREQEYNVDDLIVEQGKMGVGLFIIIEGEVEVTRHQLDGDIVHLDTLRSTDFFGELSLLDEFPRTASVKASKHTRCLALSKLAFLDELHQDAEMAVELLKEMAQRFRRIVAQL